MNNYLFKKNKLFFFALFFISSSAFSQSPPGTIGDWLMLFSQTRLSEKWSIHSEAQYRSYTFKPNTEQLLLRAGINYHFKSSAFVSIGYANVSNYDYDKELLPGIQVSENRMWQQFLMKNTLGRCFFEHRYRLEQRWLQSKKSMKYLDRIRYLLRLSIPLNKKLIERKTIFLSFYDEIFLHFTSSPFDRNRLYGALGYQFNSNANVQLGYLSQTVGKKTRGCWIEQEFVNLDLKKKTVK